MDDDFSVFNDSSRNLNEYEHVTHKTRDQLLYKWSVAISPDQNIFTKFNR